MEDSRMRKPQHCETSNEETQEDQMYHVEVRLFSNLVNWVSIFSVFFDTALDLCVHDFASKMNSKMVPKNLPFLRPLTLLKCNK